MARMMIINILLICQIFVIIDSADNKTSLSEPVVIDISERIFEAETRIIGGKPVQIKTYPFVVSVQWRLGSRHHCGGSYIMPNFILSAAHCMIRYNGYRWVAENPRFYLILAGTSNLYYSPTWQMAVTDAVIPHPGFNYGTMAHDIGFFRVSRDYELIIKGLKITKPFRITPYVNFVPTPPGQDNHLFLKKNQTCMVIGWGKTSETSTTASDILQHVQVPLLSNPQCNRYFTKPLHYAQLCAGKKEGGADACQGDSGGPLVCDGVQVGIVSWGHGCARPNSPGVYCRVDQYIPWMKRVVLKSGARSNKMDGFLLIGLVLFSVMFFYT